MTSTPAATPASSEPIRPRRRPRPVAERGTVEGVAVVALLDITAQGVVLTSVLIAGVWYSARGKRPDLLDDDLPGQRVQVSWSRYEGGNIRYLNHLVILPAAVPGPPRLRRPNS